MARNKAQTYKAKPAPSPAKKTKTRHVSDDESDDEVSTPSPKAKPSQTKAKAGAAGTPQPTKTSGKRKEKEETYRLKGAHFATLQQLADLPALENDWVRAAQRQFEGLPAEEDEYDALRAVLADVYEAADPVSFYNDDVEPGPIVVGQAVQGTAETVLSWWFRLPNPEATLFSGTWYVEGEEEDTDLLEETFVTDAILRYGCTTERVPRKIDETTKGRSLCLLDGLEDERAIIAEMLEDAIVKRDEQKAAEAKAKGSKRKAARKRK